MSSQEAIDRYQEFNDAELLNELGHIIYRQEKFLEDNKLGLIEKKQENVEYWNGLARSHADIEIALEYRGWCRDEDTGEWFDNCEGNES